MVVTGLVYQTDQRGMEDAVPEILLHWTEMLLQCPNIPARSGMFCKMKVGQEDGNVGGEQVFSQDIWLQSSPNPNPGFSPKGRKPRD